MKKIFITLIGCLALAAPAMAQTGTITFSQLPSMGTLTGTEILVGSQGGVDGLKVTLNALRTFNLSGLASVATSGAYGDLSGRPSLSTVAISGAYTDLSGLPTLGTIAGITVSGTATTGNVLTVTGSGTYAWSAPTAGTITIGTHATGILSYSSGQMEFVNATNGPGGIVVLTGGGALPTGLLGGYIGTTVQPYNAATTILGNVTTGTGTIIVLAASPTFTGTVTAATITSTTVNGNSLVWEYKNANFTAVAGHHYQVDSSGTVVVMTLPGTATNMDRIEVEDVALSAGTHNIIVTPSGSLNKINGLTGTFTINTPGWKMGFTYTTSGTLTWSGK